MKQKFEYILFSSHYEFLLSKCRKAPRATLLRISIVLNVLTVCDLMRIQKKKKYSARRI